MRNGEMETPIDGNIKTWTIEDIEIWTDIKTRRDTKM